MYLVLSNKLPIYKLYSTLMVLQLFGMPISSCFHLISSLVCVFHVFRMGRAVVTSLDTEWCVHQRVYLHQEERCGNRGVAYLLHLGRQLLIILSSLFHCKQETVNSLLQSTCMIIIIFISLSFTVYFMFYCLL